MSGLILGAIDARVWERATGGAEAPDWQRGHAQLARTATRRAALDAEEAVWLVVCERLDAHGRLGFASFVEYVSATAGWDVHTAHERIRVARALCTLPDVHGALASGALSWSAARELSRVAVPETEKAWLEACRGLPVREVERRVSGRRPGDGPDTPADETARRQVVRFELEGSTRALVSQARDAYRRRTGASFDDDAFVTALAQSYLFGVPGAQEPAASGPAAQVKVSLCPACRQGTADVAGRPVPLAPAELERLCCDAQVLPTVQTEAAGATSHKGPRPSDAAGALASRGASPPDRIAGANADAPDVSLASHAGASAAAPDVSLAPRVAGGAVPSSPVLDEVVRRAGLKVATQIPPSIRRAVLRRHHGRCGVTGCTHRTWLHIHHCDLRSEGGAHDPERLLPLCDAHHRHHHDGRLLIEGSGSQGFAFRHADGTPYGAPSLDAGRADVLQVVFSALSNSGFRQSEARQAVDAIRSRVGPDTTVEQAARMGFIAASELPRRGRIRSVREALAPYLPSPANRPSGRAA